MPSTQDQLRPNGAEIIFSDIRAGLKKAIHHPYIPNDAQDIFGVELRHMRLLRDENFESEAASRAISDAPEIIRAYRDYVEHLNALQIDGRGILVRRSYFAADPMAPSLGQDLLAEELGHAYNKPRSPIPLLAIPENSFLIFPYHTTNEVFGKLQEDHLFTFPGTQMCDIGSIVVDVNGFSSTFKDSSNNRTYPIWPLQVSFEETRSALIQTTLEISFLGNKYFPFEKPELRFYRGLQRLMRDISALPAYYPREYGALEFINALAPKYANQKDLFHWIFKRVYEDTLDDFVRNLSEKEQVAFKVARDLTEGELIRRPSTETIRNLVYKPT